MTIKGLDTGLALRCPAGQGKSPLAAGEARRPTSKNSSPGENQQGARPCGPNVRERRCVVMPARPGLNPRAKKWKAPCGGSVRRDVTGRESPYPARDGHPANPLNRYSLIVNRLGRPPSGALIGRMTGRALPQTAVWDSPAPLTRYSLCVITSPTPAYLTLPPTP